MISLDSETNQNQLNLIVKDTEIFLVGSKVYSDKKWQFLFFQMLVS